MASDSPAPLRNGLQPEAAAGPPQQPPHPLPFRLLPTAATTWDPVSACVTLNVRLDGCICPSEVAVEGARISYGHIVVIDDFVDEATRRQLLHFLLHGDSAQPVDTRNAQPGRSGSPTRGTAGSPHGATAETADSGKHKVQQGLEGSAAEKSLLPPARWERRTTDMAGAAPTWGVKQHVLQELAEGRLAAMQEIHARLARLYPECEIAHLPSDAIQLPEQGQQAEETQPPPPQQQQGEPWRKDQQQQQPGVQQPSCDQQPPDAQQPASCAQQQHGEADLGRPAKRSRTSSGGASDGGGSGDAVDCACFVANAAVEGDTFRFHVDADPTSFPDGSPWNIAYGDYFNGEPGKPLLVSLLLYLNDEWEREWGADTLFLDGQTDTGIFVVPRPCRAVLFDQDIVHRVSPPSSAAGGRPRFSLVWKLALLPRRPAQALCLARPEWGPPVSFGSAARVDAVKRRLAAEQRRGAAAR